MVKSYIQAILKHEYFFIKKVSIYNFGDQRWVLSDTIIDYRGTLITFPGPSYSTWEYLFTCKCMIRYSKFVVNVG